MKARQTRGKQALLLALTIGMAFVPYVPLCAESRRAAGDNYAGDLDRILELVSKRFHDANFNGADWKHIGDVFRGKVKQAGSKAEFKWLVNNMLHELHASHTAFVDSDDVEYYLLSSVMQSDIRGHSVEHIGVMGQASPNGFAVAGVLEGGPAEKAGILAGDQLIKAGDEPFTSAGSFAGKAGQPVKVELKREGNPIPLMVNVIPVRQNILRAYLDATEKSARVITVKGRRIAYVHLWAMAQDAFQSLLERLVTGPLHDTDGLILDLRDGYGGSPWNYADVFYRPDVLWEQRNRGQPFSARHTGYRKRITILINHGTRSAKEFLSYEMKVSHRARLVGTKTAGAFLGAGTFPIGTGGLLELPVLSLKINQKLLEDVGVEPDDLVQPQHTYTVQDAQLLAAEDQILNTPDPVNFIRTIEPK